MCRRKNSYFNNRLDIFLSVGTWSCYAFRRFTLTLTLSNATIILSTWHIKTYRHFIPRRRYNLIRCNGYFREIVISNNITLEELFEKATGRIPYGMTNDYMFHIVVQESKTVQVGLLSALLRIPKNEIHTVEIGNPIEVGSSVSDKTFILDVKITLNNAQLINIEMQVSGTTNWTDRSLLYLCRSFDNVSKGAEYETVNPVTHIGIIDFEIFENDDEFYSEYRLMNRRTRRIYNSKFQLNVLSLKNIENATDEDKEWSLDLWAKLFRAKTWEDLKMLCKSNPEFEETTKLIYRMNEDDKVREQCQQREDYEKHERTMLHNLEMAEARAERAEARAENAETRAENAETRAENAETRAENAEARADKLQKELVEVQKKLKELQK